MCFPSGPRGCYSGNSKIGKNVGLLPAFSSEETAWTSRDLSVRKSHAARNSPKARFGRGIHWEWASRVKSSQGRLEASTINTQPPLNRTEKALLQNLPNGTRNKKERGNPHLKVVQELNDLQKQLGFRPSCQEKG